MSNRRGGQFKGGRDIDDGSVNARAGPDVASQLRNRVADGWIAVFQLIDLGGMVKVHRIAAVT